MARDFARLDVLMNKYVHPLYAIRERMKGYEVAVMKTAMEILGMPAGPVRPPLANTRPQDVPEIRTLMELYEADFGATAGARATHQTTLG